MDEELRRTNLQTLMDWEIQNLLMNIKTSTKTKLSLHDGLTIIDMVFPIAIVVPHVAEQSRR